MRKLTRPSGPPEAVQAINKTVGLLRKTLIRAKPNAIPRSLRSQTAMLAQHWCIWRLRDQSNIYPGMKKMAKWGECGEWQARQNTRTLEKWQAIRSIAYAKGGRRATRYVFSGEGLFRALVHLGCNPSPELRTGLRKYDLTTSDCPDRENPVVNTNRNTSNQLVNQKCSQSKLKKQINVVPVANPVVASADNPVVNPEVTTAGIQTLFEALSPSEICGKQGTAMEVKIGTRDQRQKDAGEQISTVEVLNLESDPLPTFTSEKNIPKSPSAALEPPTVATADNEADRTRLSADAALMLDHLRQIGASTYGACASALGLGVTRAWQADAELVAACVVQHDTLGRMTEIADTKVVSREVLPFAFGARANA